MAKKCEICKNNPAKIKYCSTKCAYKAMDIKQKSRKIKITQEISRQKVRCLIYATFMLGFLAHSEEKRSLNNPDNFKEIQNIINLLN